MPLAPNATAAIAHADQTHRVTLLRVTDNAQDVYQLQLLPPGFRYVAVDYRIENPNGKEIAGGSWELMTADGARHPQNLDTGYLGGGREVRVPPGGKAPGTVIFRIPASAAVTSLRYIPLADAPGDLFFDTA